MTDSFFDVDQSVTDQLNQGMQIGGAIELPILAPYFFWKNGAPQNKPLKDVNPVLYWGGWATGKEEFDDAVEAYGNAGKGLKEVEMTSKEGKAYNAVVSRYLIVAPIAYRDCWEKKEPGGGFTRRAKWEEGFNSHRVQVLTYRARRLEDSKLEPWGPTVLTTTGYNASYLLDVAKKWARFLDPVRKKHAPNVPPWGFWLSVGTFAPEPKMQMAGKGAQSPINPIDLFYPNNEPSLDMLKDLFVGKDTLAEMASLLTECEDWLNAWKQDQAQPAAAGGFEEPPDDFYPDGADNSNDPPF